MKLICCLCGRPTRPFAFIGAMAVGPRCARKANIVPAKTKKGSAIRFAKPVKRERGPTTIDMFEALEDQ
jgi:hypothetical protein